MRDLSYIQITYSFAGVETVLNFPGCNLMISDHPVRRVISRGSVRMNGRFASFKMGRTIPWESQNEEAFLLRAELSPEVSAIYAQPMKLSLVTDSGERFHFPDFAVIIDNKLEIHEVKPDEEAAKKEVRDLHELAARYIAVNGAIYSVALASVLKADPVYTNLKALVRRLHDCVPEPLRLAVRDELHKRGPLPLVELAERTAYWGGTVERAIALTARGALRMDTTELVKTTSIVWLPEQFPNPSRLLPLNVPLTS